MRIQAIVALGLTVSSVVWSQADPDYLEQKRRMATLHVNAATGDWLTASGVPGAVIALVEGSETLVLQGSGLADTRREVVVDPVLTVFPVGDLVRVFTATAALRLVTRGELILASDISNVAGLEKMSHHGFGPLTTSDLLFHTDGIDQRLIATRARGTDELQSLEVYVDQRMPPRVRPPGVVSLPSTHGYTLLGRLIEIATDTPFDTHLQETLFSPLGMKHSAIAADSLPTEQIAIGYHRGDDGLSRVSPDFPQTTPASSLFTTGADMARWLEIVLSGGSLEGRPFLDSESVHRLFEPRYKSHDLLPGRSLALREGTHFSPPELYLTFSGSGFSAAIVFLPHLDVGLFVACNREVDLWALILRVLEPFDSPDLEEAVSDDPPPLVGSSRAVGFWQDAAVSRTSVETLLGLVRQDRIDGSSGGEIEWRSRTFLPIGSECYREQSSSTLLCLVHGSQQEQYAVVGDLVLEKIPWYRTRPVQILLWIAFATLFLAAGWPRIGRPGPRAALRPDDAFSARWPNHMATTAATLHFVFIASLTVFLATTTRSASTTLLYEIPFFIYGILSLPLVAAVFTLGAVLGLRPIWRSPQSTPGLRLRLTLLIAVLVLFLPFLWSWNLLGFRI